jgi:hypothetical protein
MFVPFAFYPSKIKAGYYSSLPKLVKHLKKNIPKKCLLTPPF